MLYLTVGERLSQRIKEERTHILKGLTIDDLPSTIHTLNQL